MCRNYGNTAKTALQVATARGWCTQDSFTACLNAVLARHDHEPITRALVASWSTGRENMPADALVVLIQHCSPHGAALLQLLADASDGGLLVVDRPQGLADGEQALVLAARHAGATGRLVEAISRETAPDSPGGVRRTPEELRARLDLIADSERQLAQLRAETEAGISGTPRAVGRGA